MVIIIQINILKVQAMFTNDSRVNLGLRDTRFLERFTVFGFVWLYFVGIWFCLVVIRQYLVQTGLAIIRREHLLMSYISQAPAHISVSAP